MKDTRKQEKTTQTNSKFKDENKKLSTYEVHSTTADQFFTLNYPIEVSEFFDLQNKDTT